MITVAERQPVSRFYVEATALIIGQTDSGRHIAASAETYDKPAPGRVDVVKAASGLSVCPCDGEIAFYFTIKT